MGALMPEYFALDVECVATGRDHNARAVAQIGLVDVFGRTLLNLVVRPEAAVVSCLTPITGLTPEILQNHGMALEEAVKQLRAVLPPSCTLVGQNIMMDVQWLGLREGTDFANMLDLAGLYRVWNPTYKNYTVFNQDHLARVLLNWPDEDTHDAVRDAHKSMQLFLCHARLQQDPSAWKKAQQHLLSADRRPSFASQNPSFEGVCMGNRKTCVCGAPFFH